MGWARDFVGGKAIGLPSLDVADVDPTDIVPVPSVTSRASHNPVDYFGVLLPRILLQLVKLGEKR